MVGRQIPTYCALCISRCGCLATVEDGRMVRVDPDPEHPTGSAICIKARTAPEFVHHPDRLTTPLRRTRPKGDADPGFEPIGWDEALGIAADTMNRLAREHGPEAVAFAVATPSGTAIADSFGWVHRLAHAFGSPNLVFATENCNWHKDFSPALTWGAGIGMPDTVNTGTILLWGFNPATSWLSQVAPIRAAQRRGAKVVVIDPRRRGLAAGADLWMAPRPGSDGALALGLANLLLKRGGADMAFLAAHSDAPFLVRDDGGGLLRASDLAGGDATDGGGVRPVVWDEAAAAPAVWDPATRRFANPGTVPAMSGRFAVPCGGGEIACRTVLDRLRDRCAEYPPERVAAITGIPTPSLLLLTEWMLRSGPVSFFTWTGTAQQTNATQTTRAITTLYALTGHLDAPGGNVWFNGPNVRDISGAEWVTPETRGKTLGLDERPLGPPTRGWVTTRDLFRAIASGAPYAVTALVSFGGNFALTKPETRHAREAMKKLELVVMTELFQTPTTRDADLILPAASCWEREGLQPGFMIGAEAQEWMQLRPQVVPPRGESRSDTAIVFALAQRLGLGDRFFGGDAEAGLRHQLAPTGVSPESLRANPRGVRVAAATKTRKYESAGFATPSGRVELYSAQLAATGDDPLPVSRPPRMSPEGRPDLAAAFPLRLTSAKWPQFCHSQQRQQSSLRRSMPEPLVEMHPNAAAPRGLVDGDAIEVRTPSGRFSARARLSAGIADDVVCSQYGWWEPDAADLGEGMNYNAAIDGELFDPTSGSNSLRSYLCEVRKL